MNTQKILQFFSDNIDTRLKQPYVSKDYTPQAKQELCNGFQIALLNVGKKLTTTQISDVFNAMKPQVRANMLYPARRGAVAFLTGNQMLSEQGILELLEWSEKNQTGYGPKFEVITPYIGTAEYFKTVQQMRDFYCCKSNEEMAKTLFDKLKNKNYRLRYIPPADSLNPYIDCITLNADEELELSRMQNALSKYEVFDAVQPKFENLVAEFNKITPPTLIDIADFIKSMILLHPFPDGNGRTFTLGILNQLLLQNNFGVCLDLDPRIALLSTEEVALKISANLIKLEQIDPNEKKVMDLMMLSKSYAAHLEKQLVSSAHDNTSALMVNPNDFNAQPVYKLTLQKYQAVNKLCNSLEGNNSEVDKLKHFRQLFEEHRELLSMRRDSAAITFLKGVLTLITLSAAYFFGIWETKGKKFGNEVDNLWHPMPVY